MTDKLEYPRKLSVIKFDYKGLPKKYHSQYPFKPDERMIYLGEIPNMPGHCVIVRADGIISSGWHIENFIELTEDET